MTETDTGQAPATASPWRLLGQTPGLDGVRGVAVLLVILTHVQVLVPFEVTGIAAIDRAIGGGYVGVDLFFVLSGFLITALLLSELDTTGDLRFGKFYARRALRLLPALYAMLALHAVYAHFAELNSHQERSTIVSAIFYVANWQWEFRPFTVMRDLGLLWSLSIEEQFYLIWPAVLMALVGARRQLKGAAIAIVIMIVAVAVWRAHLWSIGTYWTRLAVRTDTRVDALLIGALLGVLWTGGMTSKRWANPAGWVGAAFAIVFVSTSGAEDGFGYKGGLTLFALAIAAVIHAIVQGDWAGIRFFTTRPLRAIGRVSYGLYLWHFPIFWAVGVQGATWTNLERVAVALGLTTVFTLASWHFVEQPALRLKQRFEVRRRPSSADPGGEAKAAAVKVERRPPSAPLGRGHALAIGVVVVLGLAVLAQFTLLVDDPAEVAAFAEPDGLVFPGGDVNRSGYWGLIDLEPTFTDDFSRDGDVPGLGGNDDGQVWEVVSGDWTTTDGAAAVGEAPASARLTDARIAVAPQLVNDGLVEVNLNVTNRGAGLVFRYADPGNYWAITADPDQLVWTVTQVIDGAATGVSSFTAPVFEDVTVSVTQNGSTIRFLVNGTEYGRVLDPAPLTVLRSGMIALGTAAASARWDRFLVMAPGSVVEAGS